MSDQRVSEKPRRSGEISLRILTPILLFILSSGIILLTYMLMPRHFIQKYLNLVFLDTLKTNSSLSGLNIVEHDISDGADNPTYETGNIVFPKFGEQYALLEAKSIELTVGVYYGSNSELLKRGACQSTNSSVLGDSGNTVIDAHVNTFFSDLADLKVGDRITMYTNYGRFTYEVEKTFDFEKNDKQYVSQTDDDCLTLYTCKPQVLGSSDLRIGVRCKAVSREFYSQKTEGGDEN